MALVKDDRVKQVHREGALRQRLVKSSVGHHYDVETAVRNL